MVIIMQSAVDLFYKASDMMDNGNIEDALSIFLELESNNDLAPFCYYRIAEISNMIGEPEEAYELYYKAFSMLPSIASKILPEAHPSFNYVFQGKNEERVNTKCPLCDAECKPKWCYSLIEEKGYNEIFNPVRIWMYCEPCHHMFAREFPERLFLYNNNPRKANTTCFNYYSKILATIRHNGYATGMSLFEVGIGACECLLAAREIGYETYGIDVIKRHVEDAKKLYDLDVETVDFLEFESDKKWDIIIMGDVLEHVSDPDAALAKAESLLNENGALWISTPSFESAYSCVVNHNDPMRRQQYHLNYFSRESLYALLEKNYLIPVNYEISDHFNGSMEVVAIKESRDF